jgi:hypothetical protein
MSYINRNRPYNYGSRDPPLIYTALGSASSTQSAPEANSLTRPHTTDQLHSSMQIEPPVLFLLVLLLVALAVWIAYGVYHIVRMCVGQQVISRLDLALGSKGRVLTKRRAKARSSRAKEVRWLLLAKGEETIESSTFKEPVEQNTDELWSHSVSSGRVRSLQPNDLDAQQDVLLRRKSAI